MHKNITVIILLSLSYLLFSDNVTDVRNRNIIYTQDFENGLEGWYSEDGTIPTCMFHLDDFLTPDGTGLSWWAANPDINGYDNHTIVALETESIYVPENGILTFDMNLWCESPNGSYPLTGYDGANVRISVDNGETWDIIGGFPDYNCEIETSPLEPYPIPHWGGSTNLNGEGVLIDGATDNGWINAEFDLSFYANQTVKIRFYFYADAMMSTSDNNDWYGFLVDNIQLGEFNNNGSENGVTPISFIPIAGDLWHIAEVDNAPSPDHAMILQNDTGTYNPFMCNYLYSDLIQLPENGTLLMDFMIRGNIEDDDMFPEVDFFTLQMRITDTNEWYHLVDPPLPNSFTELPENWTSFTEYYPDIHTNITQYQGYEVQFRMGFFSDDDEPSGEGMMVDDFTIYQIGNPPENVCATYLEEEEIVEISWEEPLSFQEGWYHHDSGLNYDSIGDGSDFTIGIRFCSEDLPDGWLTKIRYYVIEQEVPHYLKVFAGENADIELYEEELNELIANAWNEFTINTPIELLSDQDLWIGLQFSPASGSPASCDNGPSVTGYGDLIYNQATNEWLSLSEDFGLDYNWNLQAFIELDPELQIKSHTKDIFGYNIYHRTEETNFDLLHTTDANTYSFQHIDPMQGVYHYYLMTALYDDGESVYSNQAYAYVLPYILHELQYDDGTSEAEYNVGVGNTMLVRFQAPEPNIAPTHVKFYIENVNIGDIFFVFYDSIDLGTPEGSILGTYQFSSEMVQHGWNYFSIPESYYFDDECFYVGIGEMAGSCSYGLDTNNQGSTFHNINGIWEEETFGNVMIRVLGTSAPAEEPDFLPTMKDALANYPNPFNPETTIAYQLPQESDVRIDIFNLKGQLVETIVNEKQNRGNHSVIWNAEKESSGVYLYKITTEIQSKTAKCLLIK